MNRKSVIAFSLSPIVVSAIGFIFTPVLSWWLAEDDMAKFAMFQTNVNFFALVISLGLDQALAREFHETSSPRNLLKKVLLLVLLAMPVGIIALEVVKLNTAGLAQASITAGMAGACVVMLLNRIYSSFIRMSGNGVAYAVDIVTPKVFQLSAIVLIGSYSLTKLTYEVVVAISLVSATCALCFEIFVAGRIGRRYEANRSRKEQRGAPRYSDLLKFSAPLVPGALAYYAISASAIYIVSAHGSSRDVVTISLAISVGGGLAVLQSVFSTLWTPFAYRWHANGGSPALYRNIATLVTMGCALLLLMSFFAAPFLSLIFPDKYSGLSRLVIIVIAWNLLYLVSIVGSFGIGVKRRSFTSMTISIVGAALSIGMSVVTTRYYGALGALLSVLGAFIVTLVLNCEFSAKDWERVVTSHHYLMVGAMAATAAMFSLGFDLQAQLFLASSIIFYMPKFRSGWIQTHALRKSSGHQ
jgi:O-antigen/teichoic acid export membrane protein